MSHDKAVCLYVGQSRDVETRWKRHKARLEVGKALPKFSEWYANQDDSAKEIKFILLEETLADNSILNQAEIFWFRLLRPTFYGKVPSQKDVWVHSAETKRKISASLREAASLRERGPALIDRVLTCGECHASFSSSRSQAKFCSRDCGIKSRKQVNITVQIKSLRQQGKSLRQIARIVGVSHITVRNKLRQPEPSGTI